MTEKNQASSHSAMFLVKSNFPQRVLLLSGFRSLNSKMFSFFVMLFW